MADDLKYLIEDFLDDTVLPAIGQEDPNFVFDVYIPPPHDRVWLIDINPWAQRTDPLLFSWLELLTMPIPDNRPSSPIRLPISFTSSSSSTPPSTTPIDPSDDPSEDSSSDSEEDLSSTTFPEFRLLNRDDPEAYQFASTKYSAHKLPKDVVDASLNPGGPGGMNEIMEQWKKVMNGEVQEEESSGDEEGGGED